MKGLLGKVGQAIFLLVVLSALTSPVQVQTQEHPPWWITADPQVIYVGPPQCTASFTIYVTDDYKTQPITVFIERDPRNPWAPSGFLFDGGVEVPSRIPDWKSTVTALFGSPWETPPGKYTLKIYAYPPGQQWGDSYTTVDYIIQDTGVKTCSENHVTTVHTKYTTDWTFMTSRTDLYDGWDWWDWWEWWRWDWWIVWWPWTTGEFDFSLHAMPASQSLKAGESVSFTTDVRLVSGVAQTVTLSLSGLPGGMSYSFSTPSGTPRFTSDLRISSQSSVSPGTYPVAIVGTGGGKTHSITVNLVVAENKQSSSLSLSVSPPSLKVDESVALGGALSPGLTTTVELVYTRPDGFELLKHVTTSSAGVFSDAFKPDMPGPWSVKARWPGDAEHYASESQTQSFTVEPLPEEPPSLWDQIARILPTVAIVAIILAIVVLAVVLVRRRSAPKPKGAAAVSARFCTKCGTKIPEGSGYCPNCGEKFG